MIAKQDGQEPEVSKWILLLKSRAFWAALIGVVFVFVLTVDPTFPVTQDEITNVIYVLAAYIIGEAMEGPRDPGDMNEKLLGIMKSRKFWASGVAILFVVIEAFFPDFPLDEQTVAQLVYVLIAYVLGVGLTDGGGASGLKKIIDVKAKEAPEAEQGKGAGLG